MAEMFKAEIHGLDLFEKQMKDLQLIKLCHNTIIKKRFLS